jgi:SAM-dependent methyltransferase
MDQANGQVSFVCNICDTAGLLDRQLLTREVATCTTCGSSVRTRAIVHLLSMGLFGRSLALRDFPHDKRIRGVGLSDWMGYAVPLAERLDYQNTYFHDEPRLDITQIPDEMAGSYDFLISTEVFEHVLSPVQRAFDGARRLLKRDGVMVLTVPFDNGASATKEHFPQLNDFSIVEEDGRRRLYNAGLDGQTQVFDDLIFHGGPGSTLEMRLFGLEALIEHCRQAGFAQVDVANRDVPERGIAWLHPWSVPILARA